jgi:hypothetical protein
MAFNPNRAKPLLSSKQVNANILGCTIVTNGVSQGVISNVMRECILSDVSNTQQTIQTNADMQKKGLIRKALKEKVTLEKKGYKMCSFVPKKMTK